MKVKIYTLPMCHFCHTAKSFFKKNKVDFQEINLENNTKAQDEMIAKSGKMAVPVINIDGKIIVGFDEEKIRELLDIK